MHGLELPSWAFHANTGAKDAPRNPYELLADAAVVHHFTGLTPKVGLFLSHDYVDDYVDLARHAHELGLTISSLYPNLTVRNNQPPGVCSRDNWIRRRALTQLSDAARIAADLGCGRMVVRFADNTRCPGQAEFASRMDRLAEALSQLDTWLPPHTQLIVDYVFSEARAYPRWPDGLGLLKLCMSSNTRARVLVDTTVDQSSDPGEMVTQLLHHDRLGGVVIGQLADDPFSAFLTLVDCGIAASVGEDVHLQVFPDSRGDVAALLKTVVTMHELAVKAELVDRMELRSLSAEQAAARLADAYLTDVSGQLLQSRRDMGIADNPIAAYDAACRARHAATERQAALQRVAERRMHARRVNWADRLGADITKELTPVN